MRTEQLLHRTIAGYDLIEVLGKGGMSIVFLAQRQENSQDKAAIKVLTPSTLSTSDEFSAFKARFLREAQTVHQLHHSHILPILNYGEEEDGLFYMIMPVISGGNLAHRLAMMSGVLPLEEIANYLEQLTSAVDYSNQHGVVHRDIKPSNVLLGSEGNIYLADFGIVRLFDSSHLALDDAPPTLTTTGKLYGTPAYMAPERFRGEPAEPATDIYALGILLYQLVTGQVPFEADNPLALGLKHLNEEPLRPRALRPDLPEPSEAAILKAIAKQPAERFETASALSTAFQAGLEGTWVRELLPFAPVLAASALDTRVNQPGNALPVLLSEETEPRRFIPNPAPEATVDNLPLASIPTVANIPAVVRPRREPHFWRNLQAFTLGMLAIVFLLFGGLLALAMYRLETPTPHAPTIPVSATSTTSTPTRTSATPSPTTGTTPVVGSTPSPASGSTSTPVVGSTPTPTTAPSTPAPTPTSPPPTPTTAPAPTATPTSGETP